MILDGVERSHHSVFLPIPIPGKYPHWHFFPEGFANVVFAEAFLFEVAPPLRSFHCGFKNVFKPFPYSIGPEAFLRTEHLLQRWNIASDGFFSIKLHAWVDSSVDRSEERRVGKECRSRW